MAFLRGNLIVLLSVAVLTPTAGAALTGPYTADSDTVFLFHLDESTSATSSANALGGNMAIAVNGTSTATNPFPTDATILGATGFTGFNNAANISTARLGLGYDADGSGGFSPDTSTATPDMVAMSSLLGANGAFTLEAMVNFADPLSGVTNRTLISTDSNSFGSAVANRGFAFRINNVGELLFRMLSNMPVGNVRFAIPTTGTHAYAQNTWFHAAYVYDGEGTAKLYWTKVDASVTQANLLQTFTVDSNGDPIVDPTGTISGPLVLGNEGRSTMDEGVRGLMDEIRISSVARGPSDFIFGSVSSIPGDFDGDGNVDGDDFATWQMNFPMASDAEKEHGDGDGDGDVDGADFVVWQTNFPFPSAVTPVPEPAAMWIAISGAAMGLVQWRRTSRKNS
jgi:hypothetical protein